LTGAQFQPDGAQEYHLKPKCVGPPDHEPLETVKRSPRTGRPEIAGRWRFCGRWPRVDPADALVSGTRSERATKRAAAL